MINQHFKVSCFWCFCFSPPTLSYSLLQFLTSEGAQQTMKATAPNRRGPKWGTMSSRRRTYGRPLVDKERLAAGGQAAGRWRTRISGGLERSTGAGVWWDLFDWCVFSASRSPLAAAPTSAVRNHWRSTLWNYAAAGVEAHSWRRLQPMSIASGRNLFDCCVFSALCSRLASICSQP